MFSGQKAVTVSAPGKILLAGGYLVLEAPNAAFVVAADKRFFCTVEHKTGRVIVDDDNDITEANNNQHQEVPDVRVDSPQFHSQWDYAVAFLTGSSNEEDTAEAPNQVFELSPMASNDSINPFIEKTLRICLMYLLSTTTTSKTKTKRKEGIFPLHITIQADNDFYSVLPHLPHPNDSQGAATTTSSRTPATVAALPKFLPCPKDESTGKVIVHKTGLGSSAALTTSLVGALVYHFLDETNINLTSTIHNLAQICHCHAQGKVGSGFDVSAACYGTHVYRRFPKCLLPDLLQQLDLPSGRGANNHERTTSSTILPILSRLVQLDPWKDDMVSPMSLPPGLQIVLADVRGGSESPSMARTVLKWKTAEAATNVAGVDNDIPYWTRLGNLNQQVIDLMNELSSHPVSAAQYDTLAKHPASEWSQFCNDDSVETKASAGVHQLLRLHTTLMEIRQNLRDMGEAAGVPIEPPPQTELCDATMALPGVVGAVVPGAGGYDAVVCLYVDRPDVLTAIGDLWANWTNPIICPLAVQASGMGLRLEK